MNAPLINRFKTLDNFGKNELSKFDFRFFLGQWSTKHTRGSIRLRESLNKSNLCCLLRDQWNCKTNKWPGSKGLRGWSSYINTAMRYFYFNSFTWAVIFNLIYKWISVPNFLKPVILTNSIKSCFFIFWYFVKRNALCVSHLTSQSFYQR